MVEQFNFTEGAKKTSFILMGVGVLALIVGIILAAAGVNGWEAKVWSAILTNNMFFLGISLAGVFFVAAHYIAYGGWYVLLKRIPEAMGQFLPVAAILMLPIVIGLVLHEHHIYHWAAEGVTDPSSQNYDSIIAGKKGFLNIPMFILRFLIYFALWIGLAYMLRKISLKEDHEGGLDLYRKSKIYSAIFLVVFAVTSSMMSWDFMMSIDTHWYSTLYGWYVFSSLFVSGIAVMILIAAFMKIGGYFQQLSAEHFHDLGKFLFAFSIFWTYLWFSQFMLIWYANLGEETVYFKVRMDEYPVLFYGNLLINFLVPFFALMRKKAKRRFGPLIAISIIVLFGHWIDFFLMVTPGATAHEVVEHGHTVVHHASLGIFEIGLLLGYSGLFLFVVLNALTKAPLVPVNHPFYKESVTHHT